MLMFLRMGVELVESSSQVKDPFWTTTGSTSVSLWLTSLGSCRIKITRYTAWIRSLRVLKLYRTYSLFLSGCSIILAYRLNSMNSTVPTLRYFEKEWETEREGEREGGEREEEGGGEREGNSERDTLDCQGQLRKPGKLDRLWIIQVNKKTFLNWEWSVEQLEGSVLRTHSCWEALAHFYHT